ncbi:hypothetical protein SAMN05444401_1727 [Clostridium amylolyticum]|uniref:Uncharacterized protein n=1 Tax=Clostridium amylolyticum TaxID=1121298 RepID=A0A1M6EX16_9CLOT|nr:hypothetical protein [Clostridium amylolyticum]SHI89985.1 hypothetical protein SAMN05444401_1727 [Clostridium amylolyticum]
MEEWEHLFSLSTSEVKNISSYSGLNFNEVLNLGMSEYLLYKKEAWIYNLKQSEEGREFLKTLWRLQQTKADTKAIRTFEERRR